LQESQVRREDAGLRYGHRIDKNRAEFNRRGWYRNMCYIRSRDGR
jgi:hypothetical protein